MAILILRIFSLIAGICLLVLDIYFFYISYGYRRYLCGKCKGYLKDTKQLKNVYLPSAGFARFYKRYIKYVYAYRVDGKEYFIDGGAPGAKSNLRNAIDIIYQKKNPKRAYIEDLAFPVEGIVACLICPLWIMLIICGIFM